MTAPHPPGGPPGDRVFIRSCAERNGALQQSRLVAAARRGDIPGQEGAAPCMGGAWNRRTESVMDTIICSAAIIMVALAANLDTLNRVFG